MIKIVVDAFGGDKSPYVNVEGAIKALNEIADLEIIFTGDSTILTEELKKYKYDERRVSIVHAPDIITCDEIPTIALKTKKESSLVKAYDLVKNNEDIGGLVSTGSTGAILTGSVLKTRRLPGVIRPAFCPILPTMDHSVVGVCDSGANASCTVDNLVQFALMGSLYMEKAYGKKNPRVALLNIGTEEEKGDELRKETYQRLKNMKEINFVGNMESRDLLSGKYDLVVCDGFAGNVLIKSTEGTALELLKLLKKSFMKGFKNKLGALLLKKEIYSIKDFMDYNNYGGGVMLGVNKTIIKGHGSSKTNAIYNCVKQAYTLEKNKLISAIGEAIKPKED